VDLLTDGVLRAAEGVVVFELYYMREADINTKMKC
jgi:hypothetical protein